MPDINTFIRPFTAEEQDELFQLLLNAEGLINSMTITGSPNKIRAYIEMLDHIQKFRCGHFGSDGEEMKDDESTVAGTLKALETISDCPAIEKAIKSFTGYPVPFPPKHLSESMNSIDFNGIMAKKTCDVPDCHIWEFFERAIGMSFLDRKVGQLVLIPRNIESLDVWIVANARLTVRGCGLMRQLIVKIKPQYPYICSCLVGSTSDEAIRMFKALGAEKFKTNLCPKGFVYLLRPLPLPLAAIQGGVD